MVYVFGIQQIIYVDKDNVKINNLLQILNVFYLLLIQVIVLQMEQIVFLDLNVILILKKLVV